MDNDREVAIKKVEKIKDQDLVNASIDDIDAMAYGNNNDNNNNQNGDMSLIDDDDDNSFDSIINNNDDIVDDYLDDEDNALLDDLTKIDIHENIINTKDEIIDSDIINNSDKMIFLSTLNKKIKNAELEQHLELSQQKEMMKLLEKSRFFGTNDMLIDMHKKVTTNLNQMQELDTYLKDVERKTDQLHAYQLRSKEAKNEAKYIKDTLEANIAYLENKTYQQQDRMQNTIQKMMSVVDEQNNNPELLNEVLNPDTFYDFDKMYNKTKEAICSIDEILADDDDDNNNNTSNISIDTQ